MFVGVEVFDDRLTLFLFVVCRLSLCWWVVVAVVLLLLRVVCCGCDFFVVCCRELRLLI